MIALGSDHGGLELKEAIKKHLSEKGIEFKDFGTYTADSVDYPNYAAAVCGSVLRGECERGILVCGTGIGMSMAANRHKGIRAALCGDTFSARFTRGHNDANVLCLGARVTGAGLALDIVDIFLAVGFDGGRHKQRIDMLDNFS